MSTTSTEKKMGQEKKKVTKVTPEEKQIAELKARLASALSSNAHTAKAQRDHVAGLHSNIAALIAAGAALKQRLDDQAADYEQRLTSAEKANGELLKQQSIDQQTIAHLYWEKGALESAMHAAQAEVAGAREEAREALKETEWMKRGGAQKLLETQRWSERVSEEVGASGEASMQSSSQEEVAVPTVGEAAPTVYDAAPTAGESAPTICES